LKNKIIFLFESKYLGSFLFFLGALASIGFSPFNFYPLFVHLSASYPVLWISEVACNSW